MKRLQLKQYKYLTFLSMLFITIFVMCDITAYRMVHIFNKELPLSGFIIPILFSIGDIVAEAYGYRITMKILVNGIICQCVFGVLITLFLYAPSLNTITLNLEYSHVFQHIIRANVCSCFSVSSSMLINAFLISKLKIYMNGKRFWFRTIISCAISEMVLCTLAYLLLFTGLRDTSDVLRIIYSVWIYKMIFSFLAAPFISLVGRLIKKHESDIYDVGISYKPFSYKKIQANHKNYHSLEKECLIPIKNRKVANDIIL